jgi:hypothetical protein
MMEWSESVDLRTRGPTRSPVLGAKSWRTLSPESWICWAHSQVDGGREGAKTGWTEETTLNAGSVIWWLDEKPIESSETLISLRRTLYYSWGSFKYINEAETGYCLILWVKMEHNGCASVWTMLKFFHIFTSMSDCRRGFGLEIWLMDDLQVLTASKYNTVTVFHSLQITTAHAVLSVCYHYSFPGNGS